MDVVPGMDVITRVKADRVTSSSSYTDLNGGGHAQPLTFYLVTYLRHASRRTAYLQFKDRVSILHGD